MFGKKKRKGDFYISWSSLWYLFEIEWFTPFKTYRKIRTAFKPCKWHWFVGKTDNCHLPPWRREATARILGVYGWDLGWKDKYDTPRYENPPFLHIILFRRWSIGLTLHFHGPDFITEDDYWEQALWYAEYSGCDIVKAVETYPYRVYDYRDADDNEVKCCNYSYLKEDVVKFLLECTELIKQ